MTSWSISPIISKFPHSNAAARHSQCYPMRYFWLLEFLGLRGHTSCCLRVSLSSCYEPTWTCPISNAGVSQHCLGKESRVWHEPLTSSALLLGLIHLPQSPSTLFNPLPVTLQLLDLFSQILNSEWGQKAQFGQFQVCISIIMGLSQRDSWQLPGAHRIQQQPLWHRLQKVEDWKQVNLCMLSEMQNSKVKVKFGKLDESCKSNCHFCQVVVV